MGLPYKSGASPQHKTTNCLGRYYVALCGVHCIVPVDVNNTIQEDIRSFWPLSMKRTLPQLVAQRDSQLSFKEELQGPQLQPNVDSQKFNNVSNKKISTTKNRFVNRPHIVALLSLTNNDKSHLNAHTSKGEIAS